MGNATSILFDFPQNIIIAGGLSLLAVVIVLRGLKRFRFGMSNPEHPAQSLFVIRGIRGFIMGAAFFSIAIGILNGYIWPIVFGLIFLGEELLETGIMVLALRYNRSNKTDLRSP